MDNTSIGARLRAVRETAGLDQKALAAKVGVSKPTISRWESDRDRPRGEHLFRLAETLQVDAEWLLRGGDDVARADDQEVEALAAHARREFADLLARLHDGDRTQIIRHLKDQITMLAQLAKFMASTAAETPASGPAQRSDETGRSRLRRGGRRATGTHGR
jgi:transcriptional regulator with XRE-family HTH domain